MISLSPYTIHSIYYRPWASLTAGAPAKPTHNALSTVQSAAAATQHSTASNGSESPCMPCQLCVCVCVCALLRIKTSLSLELPGLSSRGLRNNQRTHSYPPLPPLSIRFPPIRPSLYSTRSHQGLILVFLYIWLLDLLLLLLLWSPVNLSLPTDPAAYENKNPKKKLRDKSTKRWTEELKAHKTDK